MERTVESHVGANNYCVKMGSKTKTYHMNMLKKYTAREPDVEVKVVLTNKEDAATVAVAGVIHQDTDPELGEVPDPEGYRQREGTQDDKSSKDLQVPEDQRHELEDLQCMLNGLIHRYPDVFTDMPGETDMTGFL